jgi:predicted nucleic acid-binding protein
MKPQRSGTGYAANAPPQTGADAILGIVAEVFAIEEQDVRVAKDILLGSRSLFPRDALHLAVMRRQKMTEIMTFDKGFKGVPGVVRVA